MQELPVKVIMDIVLGLFWPADPGVHIWKDMEVVWAGDISVEDFLYDHQKMWDKARKNGDTLPVPLRN